MKLMVKMTLGLALAAAPGVALSATVTQFGFESGYDDDQEFTTDGVFLIDDTGATSTVVSLSTPGANTMSVEARGDDAVDGFWYDSASPTQYDEQSPLETVSDLETKFLRTTTGLSGALASAGPVFRLSFLGGAASVSGELWDIDASGPNGTEQWRVEANRTGQAAAVELSPVFTSNDETQSLDGQAWRFSFTETDNVIESLDFFFTGSKTSGIGAAFDNLSVTQIAPVPLPAGILLLGAALGGWGALTRGRRARG